jgi:hypothetical protein
MAAAAARLRTPRERSGFIVCPRDKRGCVVAIDAPARFVTAAFSQRTALSSTSLWTAATLNGLAAPLGRPTLKVLPT